MILSVNNLYREYERKNKEKFNAVDGVSLSLKRGTLTGITGPSGSGKSTLFHMITGIEKATMGEIKLKDNNICDLNENELSQVRSTEVGYIMQGSNLVPNLTIMENICLPMAFSSKVEDVYEKGKALLREFGMENMENEFPGNLSGGEQKRVAIARSFAMSPSLIIADEPTSNLDEENTHIIMNFFRKMCDEGMTVLFSTHDKDLLDLADEKYVMSKGKCNKIL